MATILAKVGQNANAMGKRVNKEMVERKADAPTLNLLQLRLAMFGSYLKANKRHERFRDLLGRKSLNNENQTREEFTNARDNRHYQKHQESRRRASFEVEIDGVPYYARRSGHGRPWGGRT